jgi:colanic acid biosynthesis glycosyl transferase WcaI
MKLLIHDYAGHPFQVELSSELARRGHDVTHSYCAAYVSGKGNLDDPGSEVRFEAIGQGEVIDKLDFKRRIVQELRFGLQLVRQVRRRRPDAVMVANTPVPSMVLLAAYLKARGIPLVLWHQDVQGIAIQSFAGAKLGGAFRLVASVIGRAERWVARRSAAVVVIAESFLDVHRRWGTADKTTVIPNWAPLEEIVPMPRDNGWAREQGIALQPSLVYSGTLGLKHNPELLVGLARQVRDAGVPVHLTVVSEGPAVDVLRSEAQRLDVPITLLPFQPYERLPEVLGSGDVLVVLLDRSAGAFSVPSKTLSYLCAGRPVLGLMPAENLAATLVAEVGGCVLAPDDSALPEAGRWVAELLTDPQRRDELGRRARALAVREFALDGCASRFEEILSAVAGEQLHRLPGGTGRSRTELQPARAGLVGAGVASARAPRPVDLDMWDERPDIETMTA